MADPYDVAVAATSPPEAAPNPYDAAVVSIDRARTQQAKTNIIAAKDANPDATARALAVSKRLNVPVDVAERNLADFEAIDKTNKYDELLRSSPALMKWMTEPVNARLATELDMPRLAGMERLWQGAADLGRSVPAGATGFVGGALSGLGAGWRAVGELGVSALDAVAGRPVRTFDLPWYLAPSEILGRPGALAKQLTEAIDVPAERQTFATDVVKGVGQIGGQIAAVIATGGAASIAMLFGQGIDQMADDVKKAGKAGTVTGNLTLLAGGGATAIAEKIGLDLLLNRVPPAVKNNILRKITDIAIAGGIEAAEETVEKIAQNAIANYYLDAKKPLTEGVIEEASVAGTSAALVRAMLGIRFRKGGRGDTQQPVADAEALDKMLAAVRETDLAKRSPEKMAEYLAGLGGGNVFVPADAVRTYFQNLEPEQATALARTLGIEGQLEQAMATGGDVVIPLHQYVAHAPEDMAAAWREDIRMRSSGMSVKEAKAFEKDGGKELGETIAARAAETTRHNAARDQVVSLVERQLQDAGESPEAARQIAVLYGERYVTRAMRSGMSGDDAVKAYARSGVDVRSDLPEVIKQAPADDIELLIRALKGKRAGGVDDKRGPSILQFIAREGGIIDDGGELASRDVHRWHLGKPFQRKAVRDAPQPGGGGIPGLASGAGDRSRYDADAWALRLWENGYFPEFQERPEISDLYEAIDQELRGKPRYVEQQGRTWQSDFNAVLADADELLNRAGIDPRTASADEIRKAFTDPDGRGYEQAPDGGAARGNIVFSQNAAGENRSLITLFKDRNLSTILHETGHLWLEELHADARTPFAPDELKADLQKVRDWLGAKGDDAITVEQHEKWARAVEAYLMEGKSPSVALSDTFARFKGWLVSIYKTVLALRVEINDEMRGVMDRLIATDEALEEARTEISARQLFASADQAGMTEAEFKAYSSSVTRTRDKAEQAILDKLMAEVRERRTAEWKAESAAVREEVRPMVDAQPDMRAMTYFTARELPESMAGLPRMKLSRQQLIEEWGNPEIVNALPRGFRSLVTDEGGVRSGDIAELLGFSDGRAMIDALTALAKEKAALKAAGDKRSVRVARIDAEVERVMRERHGDMLNDGSIEAEALSALHNEARSDVLAAEVRALSRKADKEATPYALAREWAKRAIAEKAVGEVADLSQYTRAEAKAARLAEQALAKGDADEALRRKQEQMIAHALWMEARDAKEEIEKARKSMDRLAGSRTIKSMDQDYLEKIHSLLERFDLKARSVRSVERSESLREWADAQQAAGVDVAVPQKLLDEAYKTNYRRMSVEEFRGLSDSVKQLAHLGRMKTELRDGAKKRAHEAVVAEAEKTAAAGPQRGVSQDDTGLTPLQKKIGKLMSGIRSGDASLLKIETLLEWLDGDKTGRGVFTRMGFRPIADAQGRERTRLAGLTEKQAAIYAKVPKAQLDAWLDVHSIPSLPKPDGGTKWNKAEIIAMALNVGNQSNLDKLLGGYKWDEQALRAILNERLTREEWQFVQDTWDLIETQWPDLAAVARRVNGVEPPKIEVSPVQTPFGELRGGYYKVAYDRNLSIKAEKIGDRQDLAATVGQIFPSGMTRPTTRAGATHERTGFEAPIRLSLDLIPQQITDAAHDIEFREAILNAHKFFSDDRIKQAIQSAVGPEYERMIAPWLQNIAHEWQIDRQGISAIQRFAGVLRTNVTIVGLGWRITTMLAQVTGFTNSSQRLGVKAMADGLRTFSLSPIQQTEWVRSKSAEMRHRSNDLERDMRAAQLKLQGKTGVINEVRRSAFQGIAMFDAAVSIPTWLGAYNKGLKEGMADEDAVYYADKMVRDTQGAGAAKDMAAIQRGDNVLKLFTMFYSYFNVFYNRQRSLARDVRDPNVGWGDVVNQTFFLLVAPALLGALLTGQGPEDDEAWVSWAARTVTFGLFTGVPYGRDLANAASNKIAGKSFGGAKLSPVEGFGENLIRLGSDAMNLASGEETSKTAIKNLFNVGGVVTALPLGQPGQAFQYVWDVLVAGSAHPEGVTEWIQGLIYGTPKK